MSNTESAAAAAARKTQAEYLEGLQREARGYKEAGRKDRLAEVQAEIKRTEALLDAGGASADKKVTRAARGKSKDGAESKDEDKSQAGGEQSGAPAAGADGAADGKAGD